MSVIDPSHQPRAGWATVIAEAPELAAAVRARFAACPHHVLATVRASGAPRLSGTEVRVDDRAVSLGMMPASHKLADVRRDPRVELHSAPLEEDLAEGDAKLAGRLVDVADDEVSQNGASFELAVDLVSLVRVDRDQLVFSTWRAGHGPREIRRQ